MWEQEDCQTHSDHCADVPDDNSRGDDQVIQCPTALVTIPKCFYFYAVSCLFILMAQQQLRCTGRHWTTITCIALAHFQVYQMKFIEKRCECDAFTFQSVSRGRPDQTDTEIVHRSCCLLCSGDSLPVALHTHTHLRPTRMWLTCWYFVNRQLAMFSFFHFYYSLLLRIINYNKICTSPIWYAR